MELISKAPKAILSPLAETSLELELPIAPVIDYVPPPPVPEKVLEVLRSVKWSVSRFATHHFRLVGNSERKTGGDRRAAEFEFVGHAYISPGNSSF